MKLRDTLKPRTNHTYVTFALPHHNS